MKLLITILFFTALFTAYSQTKLVEFELNDTIRRIGKSVIYNSVLHSIAEEWVEGRECHGILFTHNMQNGSLEKKIELENTYQEMCFYPFEILANNDELFIYSQLVNNSNQFDSRLSLTRISDVDTIIYHEKYNTENKKSGARTVTKINDGKFYSMYNFYGNLSLYEMQLADDSLEKELLYEHKINTKDTRLSFLLEDENYIATIICERKEFSNHGSDDSTMKLHIKRYRKSDDKIDTVKLEFDKYYTDYDLFSHNGNHFLFCKYERDFHSDTFQLEIIEIDLENLAMKKVKELNLDYSFTIHNLEYDSFFDQLLVSGHSTKYIEEEDSFVKDNWILTLDIQFNMIDENIWGFIEDKDEEIRDLNTTKNGIIVYTMGYNFGPIPDIPIFQLYELSRDFISSVNSDNTNHTISIIPNPSTDFIEINNIQIPYDFEIMDYSGRVIATEYDVSSSTYNYNIQYLTCGIYLLRIGEKSIKFIKR